MNNQSDFDCGYACQNINPDILVNSSSGGVFYSMAKHFIENGGVVFGAAYKPDFSVELKAAKTLEEIKPLMTSKYVQSEVGTSFQTAKEILDSGNKVLFSGAPCQINGLKTYLGKNYKNLTTVEFICHGMPRKQIWLNYLKCIQGDTDIESVNFRDKTDGWQLSSLNIKYINGKTYRKNLHLDLYLRGFLADIYLMPSCYNCRFKGIIRNADITFGDLWGAENFIDESINYQKGVSFVWVHNELGDDLYQKISKQLYSLKIDIGQALQYNASLLKSVKKPAVSDIFFELLECGFDFYEVLKLCVYGAEFRKKNSWLNTVDVKSYFDELKKNYDLKKAAQIALYSKHPIAIVGPWSNKNHGGALTYYALYKEITNYGYFPLMISQPQDSIVKPDIDNCKYDKIPYPPYAIAPIMNSMADMPNFNSICDTFIVGSDQWYNSNLAYGIQEYTNLSWVYATKNKAAYAASFGYDYFTGNEYERGKLSYFLRKFDLFSVRETTGVSLSAQKLGVLATWVLDPVFLCDKRIYDTLTEGTHAEALSEPYIFAYILDIDGEKNMVLNSCSQYSKLPIRAIVDSNYSEKSHPKEWTVKTAYNASHELWLKHIQKSSYVITDSFHGMCFALIYHKPFIVILNPKRGNTRFETIIDLLGLKKNIVNDVNEIPELLKSGIEINYEQIDRILEECINHDRKFLKNILNLEVKKNASLDTYDILNNSSNQYDNINKKVLEIDKNWFNATQELFSATKRQNEELVRMDHLYWKQTQELHNKNITLKEYIDKIEKLYWNMTRELFATNANQEERINRIEELCSKQLQELVEKNKQNDVKLEALLRKRNEGLYQKIRTCLSRFTK